MFQDILEKIIGFDWDDGNILKNVLKHSVSNIEAEQIFFNFPVLLFIDEKHGNKETRYHALGKTDNQRCLHITFTLRNREQLIRIISARDMSRKERSIYEKETKKNSSF